jgi:hypothetical protein
MTDAPPAAGTQAAHPTPDTAADPAAPSEDSITRAFSQSVVISGIRCMLAYVVFPWILPLLGVAKGVGPWIGIGVGVVAIGFNIASIRRFQMADHRWKWPITAINASVIVLLLILLVEDVASIAG